MAKADVFPLSMYPAGYGENPKVPLSFVALASQKSFEISLNSQPSTLNHVDRHLHSSLLSAILDL